MRHLMIGCLILLTSASTGWGQDNQEEGKTDDEVAFLLKALAHRDDGIRQIAALRLTDDEVDASAALAEAISGSNQLVALRAGLCLMRRADAKKMSGKLVALLNGDKTEDWRWYSAAYLLGHIDPEAKKAQLDVFVAALNGPSAMKSYAAVQALHDMGADGKKAEEALWKLLTKKSLHFPGVYLDFERVVGDDHLGYVDAIGVYGRPFQLRLDENGRPTVFSEESLLVLDTLRKIGGDKKRLMKTLVEMANHPDPFIRFEVAQQLVKLDPPAKAVGAAMLMRLIADRYNRVRLEAVEALGDLGPEVHTLGKLDSNANHPDLALAALLSSGEPSLRKSALTALMKIEPKAKEAVAELEMAKLFEALITPE